METGGLVQKNPINETSGSHIHNYSTFDRSLSYRLYNTLRFGDYTPSFVMEGVENDEINLNSLDRIDSLSLNAPFKGSIRKIKESFKVPNMAILPFQWDRIYAQNSNGDDVPEDANCVIHSFPQRMRDLFLACLGSVQLNVPENLPGEAKSTYDDGYYHRFFTAILRMLVLGEYVYSAGSLLDVCGYKAVSQFEYHDPLNSDGLEYNIRSYDWWFDQVINYVFGPVSYLAISVPDSVSSKMIFAGEFEGLSPDVKRKSSSSFRAALEVFRENPLAYVSSVWFSDDIVDFEADEYYSALGDTSLSEGYFDSDRFNFVVPTEKDAKADPTNMDDPDSMPSRLNLSRILAYQLVCAHFFTNSSIDFIYSAELYRQYIYYLTLQIDVVDDYSFEWNGMRLTYDYLSGALLAPSLFILTDDENLYADLSLPVYGLPGNVSSAFTFSLAIWSAIFAFRKSLRYGDYFTASRPRPLAPINTDVAVANNSVSVVNITRSIQAQRFANSVMRTRSKIEDYVKGLFGRAPAPDYHNPFYLTRQEEMIFGDEVQNTAESQVSNPNSRTANFAANVSPHTFTFYNDDMHPCIYIQIISFDIRRAYTRSVERHFLHANRFDMFNPDFQYIGDQPILGIELGYPALSTFPKVFAYTTRDMEYKQRYDQACSGFVENLPGWILTDQDRSRRQVANLDPDFIRSYNSELDQFFISLTGFSLANYFHFVCITDNNVSAKRAMAVDPQILA